MKQLLTALMLILLPACAGMKYDAVRGPQVKKVVIFGLEIQQQQPKDALGFGDVKGAANDSPELKASTAAIYNDFAKSLSAKTHWRVASLD